MNAHAKTKALALCVLCFVSARELRAQSDPVKFQGNLNLSTEVYSSSGIAQRAPRDAARAIFTPTITLFDQVSLPFEFYISNQDHGYRQPFNQFGVNPRLWNWLTLHAGYFSSQISDLTFGDSRLFGGGIELTPGQFQLSVLYGRSQKAVAVDTLLGIRGQYDRRILAAKIGYGNPGDWFIGLNILHSIDDSTSLHLPKTGTSSDSVVSAYVTAPTENAVASLAFGMTFLDNHLRVKGEAAVSAFSNDIRVPQAGGRVQSLGWFFTPRLSSQIDGATTLSMNVIPMNDISVGLSAKWVGPGFVTLGYAQLPNDVMQFAISPTFQLFNHTTSLRTSVGLQYNNLRNNHLSTTRRTITSIGVSSQPMQAFGFEVNYSNYGMRSAPRNDTLRIDNISQSLMISPRYTFNELGGVNIVVLNYSLQDFQDFNVVSGSRSANRTNTGIATWTLVLPTTLSFSTNVIYTAAVTTAVTTIVKGITETASRSFFDGFLSANLTLGYNLFTVNSTNGQFVARLGGSLNLAKWGTVSLMLTTNRFNYSDPAAGKSYGEYQGSLSYSMHF